jgi:hypothetical protein
MPPQPPRYLVKTIPRWERRRWVDKLKRGKTYLPVRAAQHYTHVIVLHDGRAIVMKVAGWKMARPVEWCGPAATEPVKATRRVYFEPASAREYPAAVCGFQGIRYTWRAGRYAMGA